MTSTHLLHTLRRPWMSASAYLNVRHCQMSTCAYWAGGRKEDASAFNGPWMAAWLTALSGAGVLAHARCEGAFEEEEEERVRDPMTTYAKYAILKEMRSSSHEKQKETHLIATTSTSSESNASDGLRDPMTSYAKYAMLKEMLNDPHLQLSTERNRETVSVVATTSVQSINHDPPPTNPADALNDPVLMSEAEARIEEATRKAKQHSGGLKIFSGNGNMSLALEISRHLGVNLGKATVGRFADGEVNVVIHENVRGKDVYIVQPTCPPVNDNIMELLLMVSTLRRSSARRITVVIPYYGYARQDRKMQVWLKHHI
jgi:N-terminal domain of ribose phosphate pyrophosphokinase